MRKYLIFIMLLLTVLACKSKQKPGNNIAGGGGGGYIKPPTIVSGDEAKILGILDDMVRDNDNNGWQNSDWKIVETLKGRDIGEITNKGFFVANHANETWLTFAINPDRNVHVGMEQGLDKLEEALALLADKDGKVIDKSWDPRKFVYNYDGENGDIRIAWLGRALSRGAITAALDMRYRGYDDKYPNALKFLEGTNKTYATLRNYPNEYIRDNIPSALQGGKDWEHAGTRWAPHEEPQEANDPDQKRKIWDQAGLFTDYIGPEVVYYQSDDAENYDAAVWIVPRRMRFGYTAGRESGFLSGIGTKGSFATPKDATLADKELGGKYYTKYDTSSPLGKTIFRRPLPTPKTGLYDVRFLTTAVAYNIRMRPSEHADATNGLFEDKYNVKEVIFEFDAGSFGDVKADGFSVNELPQRQGVTETGSIDGSEYDTHKIPLLYFSPKP